MLSFAEIARHHLIQNAAPLTHAHKAEHISLALKSLHWLSVQQRINSKLLLIVYKALDCLTPWYTLKLLTDAIQPDLSGHQVFFFLPVPRIGSRSGEGVFTLVSGTNCLMT